MSFDDEEYQIYEVIDPITGAKKFYKKTRPHWLKPSKPPKVMKLSLEEREGEELVEKHKLRRLAEKYLEKLEKIDYKYREEEKLADLTVSEQLELDEERWAEYEKLRNTFIIEFEFPSNIAKLLDEKLEEINKIEGEETRLDIEGSRVRIPVKKQGEKWILDSSFAIACTAPYDEFGFEQKLSSCEIYLSNSLRVLDRVLKEIYPRVGTLYSWEIKERWMRKSLPKMKKLPKT